MHAVRFAVLTDRIHDAHGYAQRPTSGRATGVKNRVAATSRGALSHFYAIDLRRIN